MIDKLIRDGHADILFAGFSSPTKEKFLNRRMPAMNVPFCMGVGGSYDIIAGRTKRAPLWMQNIGMEWFYRTVAGTHADVETLCDDESGVCLNVDEGVF